VLRVLAPVLVLSTISLFGSGVALVLTGVRGGILGTVHVTSFVIWGVAVLIHIVWYARRAVRWGTQDWRRGARLSGAVARRALVLGGVAIGIVTAIAFYPGRAGGDGHGRREAAVTRAAGQFSATHRLSAEPPSATSSTRGILRWSHQ
jgi:hypothetical protein